MYKVTYKNGESFTIDNLDNLTSKVIVIDVDKIELIHMPEVNWNSTLTFPDNKIALMGVFYFLQDTHLRIDAIKYMRHVNLFEDGSLKNAHDAIEYMLMFDTFDSFWRSFSE